MFHVYILYSRSLDRHYVGQTGNIDERLRFHSTHSTPYTAKTNDWQLVFLERVATRKAAMTLERRIKQAKSRMALARYIADHRNSVITATSISEAVAMAEPEKRR